MAEKRTHASPKCLDLTNCQQHVKKKRRKSERTNVPKTKPAQNILDCSQIRQPKRNVVQYLYVDPVFIEQATYPTRPRFRAGGVRGDTADDDNFYDCASEADWDENKALVVDPMQDRLFEIRDVINQIKDPKQFKDLLKEVAYTSYILYRSFRKAYGKTKRDDNEHKCEYCRQKEKEEQEEQERYNNPVKNEPIEYPPHNYNEVGDDSKPKGNLCPICLEPLGEAPASRNPDYSRTNLKNPESRTNQPQSSKLMIGFAPNDQSSQTQKLDTPKSSKSRIKEQSSQTVNPEGMLNNASPSKSCVCASGSVQDPSKVLFLKPVSISIPLKLQVESENMKPRLIETEIVLKSYIDQPPSQQSSSPQAQLPAANPTQNQAALMPPDVVSTSPYQPETTVPGSPLQVSSDIFYSCISSSGIIEPITDQLPKGEASLNEVFDIINRRMNRPKDVGAPPPPPLSLGSILIGNNPQMRFETPQLDDNAKVKLIRDQLLKEVKDTLDRTQPENVLKPIPKSNIDRTVPQNLLKPPHAVPETVLKPIPKDALVGAEPGSIPKPLSDTASERTVPETVPKPISKDALVGAEPGSIPKPISDTASERTVPKTLPKPLSKDALGRTEPGTIRKPLSDTTFKRTVPETVPKPAPKDELERTEPVTIRKPLPDTALERTAPETVPKPVPKDTLVRTEKENVPKPISKDNIVRTEPENVSKPVPKDNFVRTEPAPVPKPVTALERTGPENVPKPVPKDTLRTEPESVPKPVPKDNLVRTEPATVLKPLPVAALVPENVPKPVPKDNVVRTEPATVLKPLPVTALVPENVPKPVPKDDLVRTVPETTPKPQPTKALERTVPEKGVKLLPERTVPEKPVTPPTAMPIEDPKAHKLTTSPSLQMVTPTSKPHSDQALQVRASWSHFSPPVPEPTGLISETIQTDLTAVTATGHYKRNELRTEIREDLQELLEPKPKKEENKYEPEERDEILLDLSKLFHPEEAPKLPKQENKDNTLDDIRYLLEPPKATLDKVASRVSILVNIRYILQPKLKRKPTKKIYSKAAREKILEDLQEVLKPRKYKKPDELRIRDSVLNDLRYLLDSGRDRAPNAKRTPQSDQPRLTGRRTTVRPSRASTTKLPNEIDNAVLADLVYLLDTNEVHPPKPPATSQPVAATKPVPTPKPAPTSQPTQPPTHHVIISQQPPRLKDDTAPDGSDPNSQKLNKVDQAQLIPSPQVVDQTPKGRMDTTKAEEVSSASTLSTGASSEEFFARMYDTSPENYCPRSTQKEDDLPITKDKGQEVRKSLIQKLKDDDLDKPSRGSRNDLPELPPKPKRLSHGTQISNEHLNRQPKDDIRKSLDMAAASKSDLKSDSKRKLYRLSSDKLEPKTRKSTDATQESKARKQKDLSQIMEGSELLSETGPNNTVNKSLHNKSKAKDEDSDVKSPNKPLGLEPRKSSESNLQSGSRPSTGRYVKPTEDANVYRDRTRYSELLLEAELRPSISRYAKPIDSFMNSQDKYNERKRRSEQLPQTHKLIDELFVKPHDEYIAKPRYSEQLPQPIKPRDNMFGKPQEKYNDRPPHSEQQPLNESRQPTSRYEKPIDDSFAKPQEKSKERPDYSKEQPQTVKPIEDAIVKPREKIQDAKPIDDSFKKPQEKIQERTRYSEQGLPTGTRRPTQDKRRYSEQQPPNIKPIDDSFAKPKEKTKDGKPTDDSFVKPQENILDRTRYSEQLLPSGSRLSANKYGKPTDDSFINPQEKIKDTKPADYSFVKPQEKILDRTRYSEQLLPSGSRLSTNQYGKPVHDSTRYSEQLVQTESVLSTSIYGKPFDDYSVKPPEKVHDRTRYSEQIVQTESILSISRYGKPIEDSFAKPQEKIQDRPRYSEQIVRTESRLSTSFYGKPIDDSFAKPQEKIQDRPRYSEQIVRTESRLSTNRYGKPTDDSFVKPKDKLHDRTRYSEQLVRNESRLSTSFYGKPIDDSFAKPQEKIQDRTRYSEQMLPTGSRLSTNKYGKPVDDSTRYSEELLQTGSRQSASMYGKPVDDSFVEPHEKLQDSTRYSEELLPAGSRLSRNSFGKPTDDSFVKPQEKIPDRTRYSEQLVQTESILSTSRYGKPIDDSFAKPQEKAQDRQRYSEDVLPTDTRLSTGRYGKPIDDSFAKPQEKIQDKSRYSEQVSPTRSRISTSKYGKPIDEPQEKILDKKRNSEQVLPTGGRLSISIYGKPFDDSFVEPREKIQDRTRYSEQLVQTDSKLSTGRYDKPIEDSFEKPHDKTKDITRYSEQLVETGSRLSTYKYEKPTDDSFVKPKEKIQDKTRYSEQLPPIGSRVSISKYGITIHDSFVKPQEKVPDKRRYSEQVPPTGSRLSTNNYDKPTDDSFVKPKEKIQDRTRYSEQLPPIGSRVSISKYGITIHDSFVKPQEKAPDKRRYSEQVPPTGSRLSTSKYGKPTDDSFVKQQEKVQDKPRYSEQLPPTGSRVSITKYGITIHDSFVKPQEKVPDKRRYSEQVPPTGSRLSTSKYGKPTDDSFVKQQEKVQDKPRYSEQIPSTGSRVSISKYGITIHDSFVKPQEKVPDKRRYSEQVPPTRSRLSTSKYGKPTDDSFVKQEEKVQDKPRYSEQLVQTESIPSTSRYGKPSVDSFAKPPEKIQDRPRYSDQLDETGTRLSTNKYGTPIDDSFAKPQEQIQDRPRYSEHLVQTESISSTSSYDKSVDDSFEKPEEQIQDRTRYSEQLVQTESLPSTSSYDKSVDDSFEKPEEQIQDRTRYSEQVLPTGSRLSISIYGMPIDDSFAKPPEKIQDRPRYSEQLVQTESILSTSRYGKPIDDSFAKPEEKIQDRPRYSEQLLPSGSRVSINIYGKTIHDSFVQPQEKSQDKRKYSEQLPLTGSRLSANKYGKPIDDSIVKPPEKMQDRTRYSEQLVQTDSRISGIIYGKPTSDPPEKNLDRTHYSDLRIESRTSISVYDKPSDIVQPQEPVHNRTRYSDFVVGPTDRPSTTRYSKSSISSYGKKDRNARPSKTYPNIQDSVPKDNTRDSAYAGQPVLPQDKFESSSIQSEIITKPALESHDDDPEEIIKNLPKKIIEMANAIREDIDNWKNKEPKRQTLDHGTQSSKEYFNIPSSGEMDKKHEAYSPTTTVNKPDTKQNLSRMSDDKTSYVPPDFNQSRKGSEKRIQRQVAQYRDSVNDFPAHPETKMKTSKSEDAEPFIDFEIQQRLPAKLSNESRTIMKSGSGFSASSFAQPADVSKVQPLETLRDSKPKLTRDRTRTSDVEPIINFDIQQRLPAKLSNESRTIIKSGSGFSASSFAKPADISTVQPLETLRDSKPKLTRDRTRTSEDQFEAPSRPHTPKRYSKSMDRQSHMSIVSDLNVRQSKPQTSKESPYKAKPELPQDDLIRSRSPKESDDHVRDIGKSLPKQTTVDDSKELLPKPKTLNHATQSSDGYLTTNHRDDISKNQSVPSSDSYTPFKYDTTHPKFTEEPKPKPRKLFDNRQDSEPQQHPDLSHQIEPYAEHKQEPAKSKDSEQNQPETTSNDSKLIIQYESRPSIHRYGKPSLTSTRHQDSEIIIATGSRHPSRTDSKIYINAPRYSKPHVTATDDSKDHSDVGQPKLPQDIIIKPDIRKTYQEPRTSMEPPDNHPSSFYAHTQGSINSDDFIPFTDITRLSQPDKKRTTDHRLKNATPTTRTTNKDTYQPQRDVLPSEQDTDKRQLPKETVEQQQTSPKPRKDPTPRTKEGQEDVPSDKPLVAPEVVEEKPLIYLYSRPTDRDENKENQQHKGNLQQTRTTSADQPERNLQQNRTTSISSEQPERNLQQNPTTSISSEQPERNLQQIRTTSISSEQQERPVAVAAPTKQKETVNIAHQEETLPAKTDTEAPAQSKPPAIKVVKPVKDDNFRTAKAMVLRPQKRIETTKVKPAIARTETLRSPNLSVTDLHNRTADTTTPHLETEFKRPHVPANVIIGNKDDELPPASPLTIEQTPKSRNARPEYNISHFTPRIKMKQSTSSLIVNDIKPDISRAADNKESPEHPDNERFSITTAKPEAINFSTPRTEQKGTSTATFIARSATKPTPKKPVRPTPPSPESSRSPAAATEPTATTLEPPSNQGYVTSITIQAKTSARPNK